MNSHVVLVKLLVGVLLSHGFAQATEPVEVLYKEAKKEGQVIVWSPADPEGMRILAEAFNKDFPGVKVEQFEIRPDDYVSRVIAEARQGTVGLDVGTGRLVGVSPLLERDLVRPYSDWTATFKDLNSIAVSEDGRVLTIYALIYPVAFNSRMVKAEEVPKSWEDLLDPKWKERVIVEPRGNAFGYLGLRWGKERMVRYVEKLRTNQPIFVKGGTGVAQQLVAGAAPLAVGTYLYKVRQMQLSKAPVDWAKKVSPIGATDNVIFVMRGAKHPNAAKLFAGWLASDKAQMLIHTMPLKGITPPGSSVIATQEIMKNNVELAKETIENYRQAAALNKMAVKALGVLR